MKRLVIDTDTGVDDAQALLMAFAHPDVKVEAIMSVAGNVGVEKTTANVLKVLDVVGQDVPVYRGCDRALIHSLPDASDAHGNDGLGGADVSVSQRPIEQEHAVRALIRLANEHPGELTLVALGPLTNIALATRIDPDLPGKYKELVIMGGAVRGKGNTEIVTAEFNIFYDPDAAHIVFSEWPMLTMSDWEVTMNQGLTAAQFDELRTAPSPRGQFFRKITDRTVKRMAEFGRTTFLLPDPLAMAAVLDPDCVRHAEKRFVEVEVVGQHTRGQTTVDWYGFSGRTPNANIVIEYDMDRVFALLKAAVS
ncbi:MAG: nucleoside hydrolase [Anaerolineae bacterium]|nr:nucleoside hydrolase [Anaerolineae bacterium]